MASCCACYQNYKWGDEEGNRYWSVTRKPQEELQHTFSPTVKVRGMLTCSDKPLTTAGSSRIICRGAYDQVSKGLWVGFPPGNFTPPVQWWCLSQATTFKLIPGHFFELLVTEMLKTQHKSLQLTDPLPLCQIAYKHSSTPSTCVLRFFQAKKPGPSDSIVAFQVLEKEVTSASAQVRMTMWSQELRNTVTTFNFVSTVPLSQRPNSGLGFNSSMLTDVLINTNVKDLKIHLLPYVLWNEKTGWLTLLLLHSPCLDK